jgi:hypothetical protein
LPWRRNGCAPAIPGRGGLCDASVTSPHDPVPSPWSLLVQLPLPFSAAKPRHPERSEGPLLLWPWPLPLSLPLPLPWSLLVQLPLPFSAAKPRHPERSEGPLFLWPWPLPWSLLVQCLCLFSAAKPRHPERSEGPLFLWSLPLPFPLPFLWPCRSWLSHDITHPEEHSALTVDR